MNIGLCYRNHFQIVPENLMKKTNLKLTIEIIDFQREIIFFLLFRAAYYLYLPKENEMEVSSQNDAILCDFSLINVNLKVFSIK